MSVNYIDSNVRDILIFFMFRIMSRTICSESCQSCNQKMIVEKYPQIYITSDNQVIRQSFTPYYRHVEVIDQGMHNKTYFISILRTTPEMKQQLSNRMCRICNETNIDCVEIMHYTRFYFDVLDIIYECFHYECLKKQGPFKYRNQYDIYDHFGFKHSHCDFVIYAEIPGVYNVVMNDLILMDINAINDNILELNNNLDITMEEKRKLSAALYAGLQNLNLCCAIQIHRKDKRMTCI